MKLGMPVLYEYDSIEENLILAKSLGLDFVELNLNYSYCRNEMEAGAVLSLLKKYNQEATLHFYDEADFGLYDEVTNAYLALMKKYATLGKGYIKNINMHIQDGPVTTISGIKHYVYEKEYDAYLNRLIKNLSKAREICNKNNITLVIENTDKLAPYMLPIYDELLKNNFKLCYDIGHDYLTHCILLDKIKKDNIAFNEYHFHDAGKSCHYALGDGVLNLKEYKNMCVKDDAFVVVEVKSKEDLEKSIPIFNTL